MIIKLKPMRKFSAVLRVWVTGTVAVVLSLIVPTVIDLWEAREAKLAILSCWSRSSGHPAHEPVLDISSTGKEWVFRFAHKDVPDSDEARHWWLRVGGNGEWADAKNPGLGLR